MLNKETKHAAFIVFPMNMRCRWAAAACMAALGNGEGRGGWEAAGAFPGEAHGCAHPNNSSSAQLSRALTYLNSFPKFY